MDARHHLNSYSGEQSNQLRASFREYSDSAYGVERVLVPWRGVYELTFRLACGVILFLAPALFLLGSMGAVQMVIAIIATFTIYTPIEVAGGLTGLLRLTDASLDRADTLRDLPQQGGTRMAPPERFDIEFDHVSFGYHPDRPILENISFTVPEHSMTALVGPSGGGKSTVTRLIARFWEPTSGTIRIGGVDISTLDPQTLLSCVTVVFQDVYLFAESIRDNIRRGRPDATDAEIVDAARRARCHEFIAALPQGYDTLVTEAGGSLSGGERQRISVARAILKDAPIVLLDEVTASVDAENQYLIHQAIRELVREKTVVVIAHQLTTIADAEQILVLEDHHITQRGTHDELATVPGTYSEYWNHTQLAEGWRIHS